LVSFPPFSVVWHTHRILPGVYHWFYGGLGAVMDYFGADLTSLYRDPQKNREVGGSPDSQHLVGLAADLDTDRPQEVARVLRAFGFTVVPYASHVHVQALPPGTLRELGVLPLP